MTFYSTLFNILKIVFGIYNNSRSLNESYLLYLMTRMTANNKWFPFIHEFQTQVMDRNISFSDVKIHNGFLTDVLGYVSWIEFQFTDTTL